MDRHHPAEHARAQDSSVRVLARLPYVREETMTEASPIAPMRSVYSTLFSDPIRRGLAIGVAVIMLLGVIWLFAGRGKKEVASPTGGQDWQNAVPRPDAPEAPPWNAGQSALSENTQSTQAQPVDFAGSSVATKSPLGFDLPPGNGWGSPSVGQFAPPGDANTVSQGSTVLSWERGAAASPAVVQSIPPVAGEMPPGVSSGFAQSQPGQSPPWVNAAGHGGITAGSGEIAGRPSTAGPATANAGVVRNPYVAQPPVWAGDAGSTGQNTPVGYAAAVTAGQERLAMAPAAPAVSGWPAPVALQPPASPTAWQQSAPAPSYPPAPQGPYNNAGLPNASGVSTQWNAPSENTNLFLGAGYAAPNYQGLSPAPGAQPAGVTAGHPATSSTYSGTVPEATTPFTQMPTGYPSTTPGGWNIPTGTQPAPQFIPNQDNQLYPSTDSYRSNRSSVPSQTLGASDSQVVPAAYANPQWQAASVPGSSSTAPAWRSNQTQSPAPSSQSYPTTGQNSYSLYPTATLR